MVTTRTSQTGLTVGAEVATQENVSQAGLTIGEYITNPSVFVSQVGLIVGYIVPVGPISRSCGFVWISTDGINFTNISNSVDKLEASEQAIKTAERYTANGENAIITSGKNEPLEISISGVYSDNASEGYSVVKALRTCNAPVYIRYGPRLTVYPHLITGVGRMSAFQEPALDSEDATAMQWGFKLKVTDIRTVIF